MKQTLEDFGIGLDELASLGGGEPRGAPEYTGTKALMLAVLEDAINSYIHDKGRVRAEAEDWVATPQRRSPFSFVVVCETLGLEPQAVRTALRRKREIRAIPRHCSRRARPQVRRQRVTW